MPKGTMYKTKLGGGYRKVGKDINSGKIPKPYGSNKDMESAKRMMSSVKGSKK